MQVIASNGIAADVVIHSETVLVAVATIRDDIDQNGLVRGGLGQYVF
jgi:hypothetical protein